MKDEQRLRSYRFNMRTIYYHLRPGEHHYTVLDSWPEDAELRNIALDTNNTGEGSLLIEHASFDPVELGRTFPKRRVTFLNHNDHWRSGPIIDPPPKTRVLIAYKNTEGNTAVNPGKYHPGKNRWVVEEIGYDDLRTYYLEPECFVAWKPWPTPPESST